MASTNALPCSSQQPDGAGTTAHHCLCTNEETDSRGTCSGSLRRSGAGAGLKPPQLGILSINFHMKPKLHSQAGTKKHECFALGFCSGSSDHKKHELLRFLNSTPAPLEPSNTSFHLGGFPWTHLWGRGCQRPGVLRASTRGPQWGCTPWPGEAPAAWHWVRRECLLGRPRPGEVL